MLAKLSYTEETYLVENEDTRFCKGMKKISSSTGRNSSGLKKSHLLTFGMIKYPPLLPSARLHITGNTKVYNKKGDKKQSMYL